MGRTTPPPFQPRKKDITSRKELHRQIDAIPPKKKDKLSKRIQTFLGGFFIFMGVFWVIYFLLIWLS